MTKKIQVGQQLNFGLKANAKLLQPKVGPVFQVKKPPVAPPVYRPPQKPQTAQAKNVNSRISPQLSGRQLPGNPPIAPQQPLQSRTNSIKHNLPQVAPPVVQRTKFFPNLHPGAALPVNRSNVFKLDSVTDQYRLRRLNSHFVSVPNQRYNFVTTTKGELLLHNRYRHPSLAEGHQVLYAGEVAFNNGRLDWWSNASGHYQPDSDHAKQAALPLDRFYTYQQVLKGEHKKKNVLTNKKQGEE